jgi:amino acid transporter
MDDQTKRSKALQLSPEQSYDVAVGEQGLTRKFSLWSMLALAFSVLGTWSTFAQDLASGLTNGGPVSILWGLCLVTFCNICVAVSLGELLSSMPTALGQAYWVHRLWDTPTGRFASYLCAWINTFGWWTLTASQIAFMTDFVLAFKVMYEPGWKGASKGWVEFLVYLGITLLFTIVNLVACRKDEVLPMFNNFVGIWFGGLFVVFSMALLIAVGTKGDLSFQPASFALGGWINSTGWSDGVVWFTGLVQAAYGLTAFDSVVHMVEEIPQPRTNGPKAIYLAVVCGAASGFVFMIVCLFCIQNVGHVINSPTGLPFMQLVQDAVGLQGAVALLALFEFNGLSQGVSIATTASRLTWGFARDGGLPWSAYFARIDPVWKVPARSLWLQGFLIALVGILYLFANTVLSAILSVSSK